MDLEKCLLVLLLRRMSREGMDVATPSALPVREGSNVNNMDVRKYSSREKM
jgi:hypothetical protein